jgi:flagellar biogenesis protein FliO
MDDDHDFTFLGLAFLLAKLFGLIALVVIPIYVVYKIIKWLFD